MGIRDLFDAPAGSTVKGRNLVVAPPKEETIFSKSYIERKAREAEEAKQKELEAKEAKREAAKAKKDAKASQIVSGLPVGQVMVNVGKGRKAKGEKEVDPSKIQPKRSPIEVKTYFKGVDIPRVDHFDKLSEARKYALLAVSHLSYKEVTNTCPETGEIVVKKVFDGFKKPDAQVVDLVWRESDPCFDEQGRFLNKFAGDFPRDATYTATEFRRAYQDKCNKDERYADAQIHNLVAVDNDPKKIDVPTNKIEGKSYTIEVDGQELVVEVGGIDAGNRVVLEDNLKASVVRNLNKARGTEIVRNTTRPAKAGWEQRARNDRNVASRG